MNKFIKTNRVFLAALLLLLVIIVILLSLSEPDVTYKLKVDQVSTLLKDTNNFVSPIVLYDELAGGNKNMVLVDIRSSDDYAKGHIGDAVNIPVRDLLSQSSLSFFKGLKKTSTKAVLYGEDQLQANGPWLLLKQVGFDHISILEGGYNFYKTLPLADSLVKAGNKDYQVELPGVDTTEFSKTAAAISSPKPEAPGKKAEKIIPVKQKSTGGGGC